MADNITLNVGVGGRTVRAEDLGTGVWITGGKMILGDHGTGEAEGWVGKTNPLPCYLADPTAPTQKATVTAGGALVVSAGLTTADLDTGAGTDTRAVVGLVYAASGGAVLVSAANPLPVDTELPAAAALADATANPTTPVIGSMLHGWNGATWDRLRSSTTAGLAVDTELAAAAALADAAANPTTSVIGSYLHGYNGATWDRLRSSSANGLVVDTELPAAAALADGAANPTTALIGSCLLAYNGATFQRLRTNGAAPTTTQRLAVAVGSGVVTALNAVTANTTGAATNLGTCHTKAGFQASWTGFTGGTVTLYGSLDGTTFDTTTPLAQFTIGTDISGTIKFVVDKPFVAFRADAAGLVGSGTVTASVAAAN